MAPSRHGLSSIVFRNFHTNRFRFDTNLIDQNKESEAEVYNKEIAEEAAAAQNQKREDQKKQDQDEKNK